ncbi:Glu/Leu/Phe/Val dehydrogenase dimerization domain-containing protein [uncultured Brevibacterium sp.]|uniref:Glu/Leu/Phe/Val dehydrogenase dimerization domain-containing protein n=1 Tax=uncultured Brevibacterium sp. TaxID=189678 RepID=UPI0025F471CB|nr:Glu/Leu/Phe/Val dehydrogenase dimerization domain-containing protein [uncultured Brevibacterium sp.]
MNIFTHPEFDHHEQVVFCHDPATDLRAIIAIHDTALGPAAGGCRMHPYATEEDALTDVLRLSRGMSYKNAIAGLPLGGGKCVIIADPRRPDKAEVLRAFSRHVQTLGGRFWTAIDVGVGPEDADVLAEECDYIFARASQFPTGVTASQFTALGAFTALRAGAAHVWDRTDLVGLRVAVQGLGGTGRELSRLLYEAGAELVVADVSPDAVAAVVEAYGAMAVDPEVIHSQDVDVFAPCALGAVINDATVGEISARLVSGIANNQLAAPEHGRILREHGITFVPDFLANAGGVMAAATMIYSDPTLESSRETVLTLFDRVRAVLEQAEREDRSSAEVAEEIAEERMAAARS